MLTSRSALDDKEAGFESGADDYMTKAIDPQEFAARVRALLRRSAVQPDKKLTWKDLVLEPDSARCSRAGRQIALPPKECELLELLMSYPDEYLSTEAIILRLWGDDGSRASFANCLKRLRSKLNENDAPELIEMVPGSGYKLK